MSNTIYNAIQTPDGTVLCSRHRHDHVTYIDKNGKHYMVDGGLEYQRRSSNGDEKNVSLSVFDDLLKIRELVVWGRNFDENMKRLPATEWVLIKDLTDDHLDALCLYNPIDWRFKVLFLKEKQYRNLTLENIPDEV
jgi:hypothetical protein